MELLIKCSECGHSSSTITSVLSDEYFHKLICIKCSSKNMQVSIERKAEVILQPNDKKLPEPPNPKIEESAINKVDDLKLFEALKKVRMALSNKHNCPPYIICDDKSLLDMMKKKPTTRYEFDSVVGFQKIKSDKYAQFFIDELDNQLHRVPVKDIIKCTGPGCNREIEPDRKKNFPELVLCLRCTNELKNGDPHQGN